MRLLLFSCKEQKKKGMSERVRAPSRELLQEEGKSSLQSLWLQTGSHLSRGHRGLGLITRISKLSCATSNEYPLPYTALPRLVRVFLLSPHLPNFRISFSSFSYDVYLMRQLFFAGSVWFFQQKWSLENIMAGLCKANYGDFMLKIKNIFLTFKRCRCRCIC